MSAITIDAGPELETMVAIAQRASALIAEKYAEHQLSGIDVQMKRPGDPVTAADKEANALICAALRDAFPDTGIVAEESVPTAAELGALSLNPRVFFVDPLDGTREFVDRNPEFAVMIGLAIDGRAAAGVVATPTDGRLVAGRVGQSAFIQDADGERSFITVHPRATFTDATLVVSRSHRPALIEPLCRRLGIQHQLPCGSVGVKVLRMMERAADVYVHAGGGLKLWDTCAPEAILSAAAGRMTDLDGAQIDYASRDLHLRRGLVSTNGVLHPGVLSAVGWAEREVKRLRAQT